MSEIEYPKKLKNKYDTLILFLLSQNPQSGNFFHDTNKLMNKNTFYHWINILNDKQFIEKKNKKFNLTLKGKTELISRMRELNLDFDTLMNAELDRINLLMNLLKDPIERLNINHLNLKREFVELNNEIPYEEFQIYSKTKFYLLLLFLAKNHPTFFPSLSCSKLDFIHQYQELFGDETLDLVELEMFLHLVTQKNVKIKFNVIKIDENILLYFREKGSLGVLFNNILQILLKRFYFERLLKNSDLDTQENEIKNLHEEIERFLMGTGEMDNIHKNIIYRFIDTSIQKMTIESQNPINLSQKALPTHITAHQIANIIKKMPMINKYKKNTSKIQESKKILIDQRSNLNDDYSYSASNIIQKIDDSIYIKTNQLIKEGKYAKAVENLVRDGSKVSKYINSTEIEIEDIDQQLKIDPNNIPLKKIKAFYHYLKTWELKYPKHVPQKDDQYKGLILDSEDNMKNKKNNAIIEEHFLNAIKFYPEYYIFRRDYADFLIVLGKYEEAEENLLVTIKLDPENYFLRENYAIYLKNIGKFDKAEDNFLIALQLAPEEKKKYTAYNLIKMYENSNKEKDILRIADILEKKGIFAPRIASILIEHYEKKNNISAILDIIDKYLAKLDDNWLFEQKLKFLKEIGEESKILTEIDEWLLNLDSKTKKIQRHTSSLQYFFDKIEFISSIMIKNNITLPRTINLLLQSIQPVLSEKMNFIGFCWAIGDEDKSEKFGILLLKIGICYYRMGEIDKSYEFLTKGQEILQDSNNFDPDYLIGNSLEFYEISIKISAKLSDKKHQ